jgi:DNA-binding NtrC family response regulator
MQILQVYQWPGNVRELRNLVESMVVLAPGTQIQASDIPPEVRRVDRQRSLVPASNSRAEKGVSAQIRPELEFIFRTLVEMRVDMDQLRRDFDEYRMSVMPPAALGRVERRFPAWSPARHEEPAEPPQAAEVVEVGQGRASNGLDASGETSRVEEGVVVYRPGMSMEDLEREAIRAALKEVGGNRRKAAERLGIGERTLYRKIQRFGLES